VYNGLESIKKATTAPKEGKNVPTKGRTHKEYQEFVKEQLKARSLGIPTFFMNVYAKLINLELSRVNSILKFRYSNRGTPARAQDNQGERFSP